MQRIFVRCFLILLGFAASFAAAQEFPSKPLRIVSPNASGIAPDIAIRVIAEALGKGLGQAAIVEPRPGANGFIALEAAKRAPADGYTMLVAGQPQLAVIPKLFKKVPYETEDFAPISTLYSAPFYLVANIMTPYNTVRELVAAAKSHPGKLTYSSPYIGSPGHLGGALLAYGTHTQMLHVAYKDGAQAYNSVGTGEVEFALGSIGTVLPMIKAGRTKLLAIAAQRRSAEYPDVPTVAESGGPAGYQVDVWAALFMPRGTPQAIIARMNSAVVEGLKQAAVQQRLRQLGLDPSSSPSIRVTEMIQTDQKIYGELIERTGLAAE